VNVFHAGHELPEDFPNLGLRKNLLFCIPFIEVPIQVALTELHTNKTRCEIPLPFNPCVDNLDDIRVPSPRDRQGRLLFGVHLDRVISNYLARKKFVRILGILGLNLLSSNVRGEGKFLINFSGSISTSLQILPNVEILIARMGRVILARRSGESIRSNRQ